MEVFDRRRMKLAELLAEISAAELSRKSGVSASYISRCLKKPLDDGYKAIGELTARKLETGAKKPEGWLDDNPQTLPAIYQPNQPIALAGRAGGAMDLGAAIDTVAAAMMQTDPVDRAAAKAYLIGLCDAPDRLDLRDKIRATLEPPPAAQKPTPETGTKRAA